MALRPLSVIQGAPSGPTITPCGAEPLPSSTWKVLPVAGSRLPSSPDAWAVYHTVPSGAGATSCGCEPAGTAYSCKVGSTATTSAVEVVEGGVAEVPAAGTSTMSNVPS